MLRHIVFHFTFIFVNRKNIQTVDIMSTAELKIDLISRIANVNDPSIIEGLRKLLDFELEKDTCQLSSEQEQSISEAKAEYLAGHILPEQQADEIIEQWLSGK